MSSNGQSNSASRTLPGRADIVILGAGVMGASIAFHLAKRNAGRIVVIDKDHVGRGGSGRSSRWFACITAFRRKCNWRSLVCKCFRIGRK